jgi:2,3-bisphosphoglycerate-dependent phosphoglycerate mutase
MVLVFLSSAPLFRVSPTCRSGSTNSSGVWSHVRLVRNIYPMAIDIVYETHSTTEDSEKGIATGWLPGRLSDAGTANAAMLGQRRRDDGLAAIFVSDLERAIETVEVAFAGTAIPVLKDWRLRECDYGQLNGAAAPEVHRDRRKYLDLPYPGGESWRQATDRVGRFLSDLPLRWEGQRILVVGHVATRCGLQRFLGGEDLEEVITADFVWQEGWEYRLERI